MYVLGFFTCADDLDYLFKSLRQDIELISDINIMTYVDSFYYLDTYFTHLKCHTFSMVFF